MRTTNFDTILMHIELDGSITLLLKDISKDEFEVSLTPDEMQMFLVECGNALHKGREVELEIRERDELEKERRR